MHNNQKSSVLKIVTVEDSPIVVERIQSMLIEMDYVEFLGNAKNVATALDLIDLHKPDVAILDINLEEDMPQANGINLLIELRAKYDEMIIVMFTNLVDSHYRNTCMIIGADYFFDKSNDFEKMLDMLRELIQIKKRTKKKYGQ